MENKHHSQGQKKRKSLIIHLSNDLGKLNIHQAAESFEIPIELTSFKDLSHVAINKNEDLIECSLSNDIFQSEITLKATQNNLNSFLKRAYDILNLNHKKESSYHLTDNKLDKFFNNKVKKISEWKKKKDELLELSFSTTTLHSLPQKLLELSQFSNYLSAHIIIHSKGNLTATTFDYNKNYGFKKRRINAKDFNTIFNLIKKSKNKSFNSLLLKDLDLELIGSFLGKELELSKFNIIVIISRNDFLMPNKEEIQYFNSFSKMLPKFLTHLLDSEKKNSETIYLLDSLNSINLPIKIIENDGKEFFRNSEYTKSEDTLTGCEKIKISNDLILQIYNRNDQDANTSDLFHYQRISLLGELLNTLRHELSNPLFGLKLAVDIFDRDNLDEDNVTIFNEISTSIERSQLIIENFSNLYTHKSSLQDVSIKKLINETLTLTKSETKGLNKYIEYSNIDDSDDLIQKINPTWFVQILFNIIINSAQALNQDSSKQSKDKYFKILISKQNNDIVIKIQDNGPGIKDITEQDLFKPFETTKKTGTGLGLSISKNLAKKMGGNLYYDSKYTEGAAFELVIPVANNENTNN